MVITPLPHIRSDCLATSRNMPLHGVDALLVAPFQARHGPRTIHRDAYCEYYNKNCPPLPRNAAKGGRHLCSACSYRDGFSHHQGHHV